MFPVRRAAPAGHGPAAPPGQLSGRRVLCTAEGRPGGGSCAQRPHSARRSSTAVIRLKSLDAPGTVLITVAAAPRVGVVFLGRTGASRSADPWCPPGYPSPGGHDVDTVAMIRGRRGFLGAGRGAGHNSRPVAVRSFAGPGAECGSPVSGPAMPMTPRPARTRASSRCSGEGPGHGTGSGLRSRYTATAAATVVKAATKAIPAPRRPGPSVTAPIPTTGMDSPT